MSTNDLQRTAYTVECFLNALRLEDSPARTQIEEPLVRWLADGARGKHDHLIYQEVADMEAAIMEGSNLTGLDVSCFTGEYVTGTITPEYLDWVERNQLS